MTGLPHGLLDREACAALDAADPLAPLRGRFLLDDGLIYLDGNSLGALPAATPPRLAAVVAEEWGRGLIRSWTAAGWIDAPRRLGDKVAPLVGARPGEVVVADSTSVNLFKLLGAAVQARPGRRVILSHEDNFPADLYVAQGLCELLEGRCE
ncbi:MAG TPA: kynureninase, partial [Candidatus Dormibacteraeota bacterium]